MVRVKICGITNLEDACMCSKEGADALGFIFWKKSARSISVKNAQAIIKKLDPYIIRVGVFVDEEKEKVLETASLLNLDAVQFHGNEPPSYCSGFGPRLRVIKTLFPQKDNVPSCAGYRADACLLDIRWEHKIKSSQTISIKDLTAIKSKFKGRLILSGGLDADNVALYVKKVQPYAVDVARGVESLPGKKDAFLVRRFIAEAKRVTIKRKG